MLLRRKKLNMESVSLKCVLSSPRDTVADLSPVLVLLTHCKQAVSLKNYISLPPTKQALMPKELSNFCNISDIDAKEIGIITQTFEHL